MSEWWFCFACGKWHVSNFCARAQIRGCEVTCEEEYRRWVRDHIHDLRLMLHDAEEEVKKQWREKRREKK